MHYHVKLALFTLLAAFGFDWFTRWIDKAAGKKTEEVSCNKVYRFTLLLIIAITVIVIALHI